MTATPIDPEDHGLPLAPPCPAYRLSGKPSLAECWQIAAGLLVDHPGHRPLVTLRHQKQAYYTSFHGCDVHGVDVYLGEDLSYLSEEEVLEVWAQKDPPPPLIHRRQDALSRGAPEWSAMAAALPVPPKESDPVTATAGVLDVTEDSPVLYLVPSETAAGALTALPNGYFAGDLTPFQTYALARRMEEAHGLALFGMGAPWLAFAADGPIGTAAASGIARDIGHLFDSDDLAGALEAVLIEQTFLILPYTGG